MPRCSILHLTLLLIPCLLSIRSDSVVSAADKRERPNILIITVDDMSCDSVGAFGCKLEGTTPNIDRLASEGLRFEHAHVQVGNCMPSRNVLLSGRYPHNNRVEGFYQVKDAKYPVLADAMRANDYFTAIRGKVSHSTPYNPYGWDLVLDQAHPGVHPKRVESYYDSTKYGIKASRDADQPFCLVINVSDPHKPFYSVGKQGKRANDPNRPSRVFTPTEVPIPGFLFDDPQVRTELALYYSTVRRADDCVGAILRALSETGHDQDTVVFFLSDHGMPLPFAKTALYHHSTRTPWIVRYPGITEPNTVDRDHMISAVDLFPTLLELLGASIPEGIDGRSFAALIQGHSQQGRDYVFKEYNENSGGARHPMRSVQSKRFGYIFNPWADGKRVFRTATQGTATYRRMKALAPMHESIAARLELFDHRVVEEFYDYANDPDALQNLIDDPRYQTQIAQFRDTLEDWMVETGDHALEAFRGRNDPELLDKYMTRVEKESAARRASRKKRPLQRRLITLSLPESAQKGKTLLVSLKHRLPEPLKTQSIHVTLKDGTNKKRIERKVIMVSGNGTAEVQFQIPEGLTASSVHVAAFVGPDYQHNLQHIASGPIRLEIP